MRPNGSVETWTVYQTVKGNGAGIKSVCTDSEWQALEVSHPGVNVLVQRGIINESDAEKLARGTSGDAVKRPPKRAAKPVPEDEGKTPPVVEIDCRPQ